VRAHGSAAMVPWRRTIGALYGAIVARIAAGRSALSATRRARSGSSGAISSPKRHI